MSQQQRPLPPHYAIVPTRTPRRAFGALGCLALAAFAAACGNLPSTSVPDSVPTQPVPSTPPTSMPAAASITPVTLKVNPKDSHSFIALYDTETRYVEEAVEVADQNNPNAPSPPAILKRQPILSLWLFAGESGLEAPALCERLTQKAQFEQRTVHRSKEIFWQVPLDVAAPPADADAPRFSDKGVESPIRGGFAEVNKGAEDGEYCQMANITAGRQGKLLIKSIDANTQTLPVQLVADGKSPFRFSVTNATVQDQKDAENPDTSFSAFPCPGLSPRLSALLQRIDSPKEGLATPDKQIRIEGCLLDTPAQ